MRVYIYTFSLMLLVACACLSALPEAHYQSIAAKLLNGAAEVTMADRTRCDIVTDTHAIEVDWNGKWGEAIGQSLHYALLTNKRAGIILIMDTPNDTKESIRVNSIITSYDLPVTLWVIDRQNEELTLFSEE